MIKKMTVKEFVAPSKERDLRAKLRVLATEWKGRLYRFEGACVGTSAGFPDVMLVVDTDNVFLELKVSRRIIAHKKDVLDLIRTDSQLRWHRDYAAQGCANSFFLIYERRRGGNGASNRYLLIPSAFLRDCDYFYAFPHLESLRPILLEKGDGFKVEFAE